MNRRSLLAFIGLAPVASVEGIAAPYAAPRVERIDPARLIYRLNGTPIGKVSDGGHALTFAGDFCSHADLVAAPLSPGQYATANAVGLFRLGGVPVFEVTAGI